MSKYYVIQGLFSSVEGWLDYYTFNLTSLAKAREQLTFLKEFKQSKIIDYRILERVDTVINEEDV